jgi:hypothetical protein
MKKILFLALCLSNFKLYAQLAVTDPGVVYAIEQSNTMQSTANSIQTTTKDGVAAVGENTSKLLTATQNFQKALEQVNSYVTTAQTVTNCFNLAKMFISSYGSALSTIAPKLPPASYAVFLSTMSGVIISSTQLTSELQTILTPQFYKMNDNERLTGVQKINDKLNQLYVKMIKYISFMQSFALTYQANKTAIDEITKKK